ncbi:MAG: hypothetical protein LBS35_07655 [Synergistaceae bacterium]|nr:hypothetical protein [Synergistaceae bacterium]
MRNNDSIKRALFFSFIAALCWAIADATKSMGESMADGGSSKVTFAAIIFWLSIDFILCLLNLLPATITWSMTAREPLEPPASVIAALVHYATFLLVIRLPYGIITGSFRFTPLIMAMCIAAYIGWAITSYVAAYIIITMPPISRSSMEEILLPLDDSEKCLTALGEFMTTLAGQLGERRRVEQLWSPVYSYLKDKLKVQKLIVNKGLKHDEIALNAVGSIAFKLLASGKLHSDFGTLSPDGEYVRKIWWLTANELVRRSYYRPEDVSKGLEALDSAIVSVGVNH